MRDKYVIAKYLRLSVDDGDKAESDSIANQRSLIDLYIDKEFSDRPIEAIELVDDGYSGTNMNRPSVKKLLILAETHSVDCIIVKDFSRFARDYIEIGNYLEYKFPEWEIRFISVNDRYDSKDYRGITGGTDVALKNITYSLYSIDLSEKVKSARRIQSKMGKFLAPYAFYGYVKDPDNKGHIIIDEPAAEIVRRIFNMRLSGRTTKEIAQQLNKDGVLTPAEYKKSIDPLCREWNTVSKYKCWTASMITNITSDERYTGKLISHKFERVTVGSPQVRSVKKEDRIVVENTHEPIVSSEVYNAVRAIAQKRTHPNGKKIGLKGFVRCGGCGHLMNSYGRADATYMCSYKQFTKENDCFKGKIKESQIAKVVTAAIKAEIAKAADISKIEQKRDDKKQQIETEIERLYRKIADEKRKITELYIRLTKNELTEGEFTETRSIINDGIDAYTRRIENLTKEAAYVDSLSATGIFDKYIGTEEINRQTIEDLIKAIYIYPDNRIEIVWTFKEEK